METGDRIRALRTQLRMTQKQLAEKANVSEISIRQYEGKKRTPRLDQLAKISNALGVEVTELIEGDYYYIDTDKSMVGKTVITDPYENVIINFFRQLNDLGKNEAMNRLGELTLIDAYKKEYSDPHFPKINYTIKDNHK